MSNIVARASALAVGTVMIATGVHAAPQQLVNKTINVSFSVSTPAKGSDGSTRVASRQVTRMIYISSQGRLFMKVMRSAGRNSETKERGPEDAGKGSIRFVGNRLVGVLPFISGANQLTISFDPSFQSCTAEMIAGGEGNKPRVWKGINGVTYTATGKTSVSGVSCSIQQGNAFAS